jgi:hypothetical protein
MFLNSVQRFPAGERCTEFALWCSPAHKQRRRRLFVLAPNFKRVAAKRRLDGCVPCAGDLRRAGPSRLSWPRLPALQRLGRRRADRGGRQQVRPAPASRARRTVNGVLRWAGPPRTTMIPRRAGWYNRFWQGAHSYQGYNRMIFFFYLLCMTLSPPVSPFPLVSSPPASPA